MKKFLKYFFGIVGVLIIALVLKACHTVNILPQDLFDEAKVKAPYDAVIVPGFPYQDENWPFLLKYRVYWSHYLYEKGMAKNLIFTGSAVYTPYVESKIMALYAEALGIPEEHIFIEDGAEYSPENLWYSYHLAKDQGFDKVGLATDPFQSAKMGSYIKKFKFDVDLIPIVHDTLMSLDLKDIPIDDSKAFVKDFVSIKERQSLIQRWKGATGQLIKKRERQARRERK